MSLAIVHSRAQVGVEAPAEMAVMREELAIEIQEAEQAALDDANLPG